MDYVVISLRSNQYDDAQRQCDDQFGDSEFCKSLQHLLDLTSHPPVSATCLTAILVAQVAAMHWTWRCVHNGGLVKRSVSTHCMYVGLPRSKGHKTDRSRQGQLVLNASALDFEHGFDANTSQHHPLSYPAGALHQ